MTFSLPSELAALLVKRVPARERSRYLAEALGQKLQERERALIRACEIANDDTDAQEIEREWDSLNDLVVEPPSARSLRKRKHDRPPG